MRPSHTCIRIGTWNSLSASGVDPQQLGGDTVRYRTYLIQIKVSWLPPSQVSSVTGLPATKGADMTMEHLAYSTRSPANTIYESPECRSAASYERELARCLLFASQP